MYWIFWVPKTMISEDMYLRLRGWTCKNDRKKTQCNPQLDQLAIFWYFFWFGIPAINHKPKRWGWFNGFNPSLPKSSSKVDVHLKAARWKQRLAALLDWIIVIGSVKLYVHYSYMCELCVHSISGIKTYIFKLLHYEFCIFIINSY